MEKVEFYTINITNKKIYLASEMQKEGFYWSKNKNEALCFNDEKTAFDFATNYFKRFKNWVIIETAMQFN